MIFIKNKQYIKALSILAVLFCVIAAQTAWAGDWALSLYGGQVTDEHWEEVFSTHVQYHNAYLVAAAVSRTAGRYIEDALSLDLEIQAVKYFGGQENWELNLPIMVLRWHRFPWNPHVATTFAWGISPSYASEFPKIEEKIDGGSAQWMVYWFAEFTVGPPGGQWALLTRLHHRSEAFGIVADRGGSNSLVGGLKIFF